MTKLSPIYLRPGQDPTLQEHKLRAPGCGGFILMGLIVLALATNGAAFLLSKQTAAAHSAPTLAQIPSSTATRRTSATSALTASVRAYLTHLPPRPSETNTATPTNTYTASPGPSPTRTNTPTRTPTATRKPAATRRPASQPRTSGGGGSGPSESQPQQNSGPAPQQPPKVITVWAPPIAATCCKALAPMYTWTPNAPIQPPTATPTIPPTQTSAPSLTPTPTSTNSPTAAPTLPAPTAMLQPSNTPIPPTATLQPSPTAQPSEAKS